MSTLVNYWWLILWATTNPSFLAIMNTLKVEAHANTQRSVSGIHGIQPIAYQLQSPLQGFPTRPGSPNKPFPSSYNISTDGYTAGIVCLR